MDKSTLSNYGWIIIVTLILAVMLALATPFGTYVGDGVVAVANSFVQSADSAMDEDNIDQMAQEWEGKLDYSAVTNTGNKLNHYGIIPTGGVYVTGIKYDDMGNSYCCSPYGMWCWCDATTYKAGDSFPSTVQRYDVYAYGDYVYMYDGGNAYYGQAYNGCPYEINIDGVGTIVGFHSGSITNGWCVGINNTLGEGNTRTSFGAILESINNKPITDMSYTFYCCTMLTVAPAIPSSVTNMCCTFYECTSLTTAPAIPNGVTDMSNTFSVCTSLASTPVIPNSVTNMSYTFYDCTSLTGTITINANPMYYDYCFYLYKTGKPITLTGSSTMLQTLANTSNNSYRTITIQ